MSGRNLLFLEEISSAIMSTIPLEARKLILKSHGKEGVDDMKPIDVSNELSQLFFTKAILELHQMVLESAHNNDVVIA